MCVVMHSRLTILIIASSVGIAKRKRAGRNKLRRVRKQSRLPPPFRDVQSDLKPHLDQIVDKNAKYRYKAIGLANDVNELLSTNADEQESTPLLMRDPPAARKRGAGMSLNEARYLQKLIAKHDDDYAAMARDIKLNYDQKTASQLKKRVGVYRLVYGAPTEPIQLYLEQPKGKLPFQYHDPRPVTEPLRKPKKKKSTTTTTTTAPSSETPDK